MVDHIVSNYRIARPKIVEYVQQNSNQNKKKVAPDVILEVKHEKSKSVVNTPTSLSNFTPAPKEFVECPICGSQLRAQFINYHLDACQEPKKPKTTTKITSTQLSFAPP
jgi:hypothetical protein